MKIAFNIVGSIAVLLALLGIFLPLLPTTPFLLLASACYMRGSTRMHAWLRNHPLLGQTLRDYEDNRSIPLRAKIVALLLLWVSLTGSIWIVGPLALKALLTAIGIGVSIFLLKMKTSKNTTAPA